MKVLIIANEERYRKYMPDTDVTKTAELIFCPLGTNDAEMLRRAADAAAIIADAIAPISEDLISQMPGLKLIQSEGVGYNAIDIEAARKRGVTVCNNKGINAGAVAEQTILLMLALLRDAVNGDGKVRAGLQIQTKEKMMLEGITELADCRVGLIGFGDIAKAVAKRLIGFGCETFYYSRSRAAEEVEKEYSASYLDRDELLASCDIISLHLPVTGETRGIVSHEFINMMKPTAYLINTARGEIVDNEAMRDALIKGRIAGAAFDTVHPEPTLKDNILVDLPSDCRSRVIFSPHIGGITSGTFYRAHRNIWRNIEALSCGKPLINIV